MQEIWSFLLKLIAGVTLFLAPVRDSIFAVFALVLVDLVFGLLAARKQGQRIESRKLAHTPLKFGVYFATIVVMFMADTWIGLGVPACKIVTGIIGATEALSLLEKAQILTGAPVFEKLRGIFKPEKGQLSLVENSDDTKRTSEDPPPGP
jgi:hypothetical protein